MAMRRSEAYQPTELDGSYTKTAFSDPDLFDPLPSLFSDLLTPRRAGTKWQASYNHAIIAAEFR
jgi:hypothetical protein